MANRTQFDPNNIGASSGPIDTRQVMADANNAFAQAMKDAAKIDPLTAKKETLFGMEMDPMMAVGVNAIVNNAAQMAMKFFAPRSFDVTNSILKNQFKVGGNTAAKVAGVATLALSVGMKGAKQFGQIYGSLSEARAKRVKLAHVIAPVLDDLKGSHSVGALMRVGRAGEDETGNNMIWAQRQHDSMIEWNEIGGHGIDLLMNAGPNLLLDLPIAQALIGSTPGSKTAESHLRDVIKNRKDAPIKRPGDDQQDETPQDKKGMGGAMLNSATPMLAEMFKKSNAAKLQALPKHSALDMVLTLEELITNDATKPYYSPPGNNSRPLSLENYIAAVMVQHQKEMSLFDPEQAEIRKELQEDLALVAKPMAKALRAGTIGAMSLVRLIGENHVIKSHGRVIASADEVSAQIERMAGKTVSKLHQDPKDYYGTASFTKEDLKGALKSLEGDERLMFASWFPDAVLEEVLGSKEVQAIREATKAGYEKGLLEALSGLGTLSDQELKEKTGLAAAEIKQLRDMLQRIEKKGPQVIKELRESPANTHSAEHLLGNALVVGAKEHLGTVIATGRDALAEAEHASGAEAEREQPAHHRKGVPTHGRSHVDAHHESRSRDGDIALPY